MNWITWVLIFTGVGLNAAAQLLLKVATRPLAAFSQFDFATLMASILVLARSAPFWVGMFCYGASLCVWLAALSRAPVSIAYPMLSIGYIVSALAGWLLFSEAVSASRVAGIGIIIVGVWLVARS